MSLYKWNLKRNDTNELIYRTETENEFMVARGEGRIIIELGICMYTLLYLKWIPITTLLIGSSQI